MNDFRLSQRSVSRLNGVHPDLVKITKLALKKSKYDFGISEGVRTQALQDYYVSKGRSTTRHGLHLIQKDGYSHAIDFYVLDERGKVTWKIGYYRKVMQAFVHAAIELGYPIDLGGLWQSFVDGPHVQLSKKYRV